MSALRPGPTPGSAKQKRTFRNGRVDQKKGPFHVPLDTVTTPSDLLEDLAPREHLAKNQRAEYSNQSCN
jgi:hypothetical protein